MTTATARETMDGVRAFLAIGQAVGIQTGGFAVRSVTADDGSDVAVLALHDVDESIILVGTVDQETEDDTCLRLSPAQARDFAAILQLAADEIDPIDVESLKA